MGLTYRIFDGDVCISHKQVSDCDAVLLQSGEVIPGCWASWESQEETTCLSLSGRLSVYLSLPGTKDITCDYRLLLTFSERNHVKIHTTLYFCPL